MVQRSGQQNPERSRIFLFPIISFVLQVLIGFLVLLICIRGEFGIELYRLKMAEKMGHKVTPFNLGVRYRAQGLHSSR